MSEWISVDDRLPPLDMTAPEYERSVSCIVFAGGNVVEMDYRSSGYAKTEKGRMPRWEWRGRISPWPVTHWMPLPAPPSAGEQNGE